MFSIRWWYHFGAWIAKHVQSTKNNKFTISLQYLNQNMKDEVDFLPADEGFFKLILSV